jgi:hypothetical protein
VFLTTNKMTKIEGTEIFGKYRQWKSILQSLTFHTLTSIFESKITTCVANVRKI